MKHTGRSAVVLVAGVAGAALATRISIGRTIGNALDAVAKAAQTFRGSPPQDTNVAPKQRGVG